METPELFPASGFYASQFNHQDKRQNHYSSPPAAVPGGGDHFAVEDLLDFSNEDAALIEGALETVTGGNSTDSSTVTGSCNSSFLPAACHPGGGYVTNAVGSCSFTDNDHFSVPHEDMAELEWLSNFVEESFSSEEFEKLQLISGQHSRPDKTSETLHLKPDPDRSNPTFDPDMLVPGKARSKRSRAVPCNWASRLLTLSPTTSSDTEGATAGEPATVGKKTVKAAAQKKKEGGSHHNSGGDGRKCLHCATDKTPQWRTGPLGPKTLCNACGVRYKSGRLVPEYRPAASPTFVLAKHSNSHRKVMELRRQKEMQVTSQHHHHQQQFMHHHHQNLMFDVTNGEDYLIHQHVGPDFRQLI